MRDIGTVDLEVGARVSVGALGHQLLDTLQGRFSALGQLRALRFRTFNPRRDDLRPRRQANDHADALQRHAIRFVNQHAAAGRNHLRMRPVAKRTAPAIVGQIVDHFAFELTEARFAMVGEDLRDRFARARNDGRIDIDEFPPQPPRDNRPHRAFAGSHESGDDQFRRHCVATRACRFSNCGPVRGSL